MFLYQRHKLQTPQQPNHSYTSHTVLFCLSIVYPRQDNEVPGYERARLYRSPCHFGLRVTPHHQPQRRVWGIGKRLWIVMDIVKVAMGALVHCEGPICDVDNEIDVINDWGRCSV